MPVRPFFVLFGVEIKAPAVKVYQRQQIAPCNVAFADFYPVDYFRFKACTAGDVFQGQLLVVPPGKELQTQAAAQNAARVFRTRVVFK